MTTVWRGDHFNLFVRPESRILVNEFDYKGVNQVIYQENGVTIRSIPAVRALELNGTFLGPYSRKSPPPSSRTGIG